MLRFILRRLALLVPLLIAISFVSFALAELSASDPAEVSIRVNAMVPTPELIAQTRHEFGLDRPLLERYVSWIFGAVQGDFGLSFVTRLPVRESLMEAFPATLALAGASLLIILTLSVSAGIVSALNQGTIVDFTIRAFIFCASAMPAFWAAMLLILFFSVNLSWFPTSGMRSTNAIVLPAITLSLAYIGTYMRLIRTEMLRTSRENWVLFAKGRGLPRKNIIFHMLKNSLRGCAAGLGMSIPKLIAGAFVVETIFAWPGIGRLCVEAIFNRDLPIVQAYVLIMGTLFIVCNLISDVVILLLDPRERRQEGIA